MKKDTFKIIKLCLVLICLQTNILAGKEGLNPNSLFLRFQGGLGQSNFETEGDGQREDASYSGTGLTLNAQGGWAFTKNLAVHGGLSYINVPDQDWQEAGNQRDIDISYNQLIWSIGLSYYFISTSSYLSNIYISPELRFLGNATHDVSYNEDIEGAMGTVDFEIRSTFTAKLGFGLTIGKELYPSSNSDITIGVALVYYQDNFDGNEQDIKTDALATQPGMVPMRFGSQDKEELKVTGKHSFYGAVLYVNYN